MNNLVPMDQAAKALTPFQRQVMDARREKNRNFSDNVREAFPILSIKGKVFRVRLGGETQPLIDPATRQPVPFLDVVMIAASPHLSKSYYAHGFVDGEMNPPDCWSLDGLKPDASVANKQSLLCGNCPKNAFGSKITDAGKAAKACQDARRVAVVMPGQLKEDQQLIMLLRVPQSSLKNMKNYADRMDREGMAMEACISRLAFDYQEAYPKLVFNFVNTLDDDSLATVVELADAPAVKLMLSAPDFETAPSVGPLPNASGSMQAMPVQATPILEGAIPVPSEPARSLITLPDGTLFDPTTGEYVTMPVEKKVEKKVEMDPMTIALPDGKFFSQRRNVFVTGPEMDAPDFQFKAPVEPPAEKKTRAKKTADPAKPATPQTLEEMAKPQQPAEPSKEASDVSRQSNTDIKAASAGLESLLSHLVAPNT